MWSSVLHEGDMNYFSLAETHDDDSVHLRRELIVTKAMIRIVMMTTVFIRRHTNRLGRLRLGEGVPSFTHTQTWQGLEILQANTVGNYS